MEIDISNNNLKKNIPQKSSSKNSSRKEKKKEKKYNRFIKTNLYLNEYNYFFKNAIKMNKLREEKYKENKIKTENALKANKLPKMLYFNKYLNNNSKKLPNKNSNNSKVISKSYIYSQNEINYSNPKCISSENRTNYYSTIENAIEAQNIEENNKSHIKKTIRAFDDLIQYVDSFQLQNNRKKIKLKINQNNERNNKPIQVMDNEEISGNYNDNEMEEELNVENYNFDEYKRQYKNLKLLKKNNNSQGQLKTYNSLNVLQNNYAEDFNNVNNIYITASNGGIKKMRNLSDNNTLQIIKQNELFNSVDNKNNNIKKKQERKKLIINNMALISDDLLVNKIKNVGRDFKNGLYFNEYGKFKFTELGLSYPNSFDKYKKIPDYKGNDIEEKKVFKYRSIITNPKYNYTNIGTFNEKFNNDLSDISTYYGKEYSKGRFLRNPLISFFSKYIPNYEKYKDLKFIENRYISKNKYKFRLKPLINNKKNNFDKLASIVYKNEHKHDHFQ